MAQNSRKTAPGRPFPPGTSGNPGGRPKGFVNRIKERCGGDDYDRLAEGFAVIAFGDAKARREFFGEDVTVGAKDRLLAMVELRDSGPGRPNQRIETEGGSWRPLFAIPRMPDFTLRNDTDASARVNQS